MWGAQPFVRRKMKRRGVAEPGYLVKVPERFGRYDLPPDTGRIWIHAVSLGETRAAGVLLKELRKEFPNLRLLLTCGTATGREEGAKLLLPGDVQTWQPWDTPQAVKRFFDQWSPSIGILMETEVWPNLARESFRRGIPMVLANARLNEKSLAQHRKLSSIAEPAFESLAAVWAQTESDAARFRQIGGDVKGVFGNLKFDATPDEVLLEQGRAWRRATPNPVVMIASSREGEEALLLDEIDALRASGDVRHRIQWLIVPRHPQRFDEVAMLAKERGFSVSRRSGWTDGAQDADVWIGDSLGEMPLYYGLADVALLGGSFEPLGGQNLIEASACGCPVVLGPSTFNFAEAAELAIDAKAAVRADNMSEAVRCAIALVNDPAAQSAMANQGLAFAAAHRGAASKTAKAVAEIVDGLKVSAAHSSAEDLPA